MIEVPAVIKTMLHNDTCPKNIRIHFPNGERTDICNDLIVKNSVSFTESLCSQNTLKFGLCESPIFECEVVGVGNVKGATIEVSCEIYCDASVTGAEWRVDIQKYVYAIPYGTFVVDECKRQADLQHRKMKAYSFYYYDGNLSSENSIGNFFSERISTDSSAYVVPIEAFVYEKYPFFFDASAYDYTEKALQGGGSTSGTSGILRQWQYGGLTYVFHIWDYTYRSLNDGYYNNKGVEFDIADINIDSNYESEMQDMLDTLVNDYGMPPFEDLSYAEKFYPPYAYLLSNDHTSSGEYEIKKYIKNPGKLFAYKRIINISPNSVRFHLYTIDQYQAHHDVFFRTIQVLDPDRVISYKLINNINTDLSLTLEREYTEGYRFPYILQGYSYKNAYDEIDTIKMFRGVLELQGLLGAYSRFGMSLVNIKQKFLFVPNLDLYPGENVYPRGSIGGKLLPQDYQSCWYDDSYTLPYGIIHIDFKTVETVEGSQTVIDAFYDLYLNGITPDSDPTTYQIYKVENNDVIKSSTWTSAQILSFCENIAANLSGVRYMPVDFVGRGLPYVEAGDTFEILTRSNDSITTIVLNRTLKGEQTLTDSYKSV